MKLNEAFSPQTRFTGLYWTNESLLAGNKTIIKRCCRFNKASLWVQLWCGTAENWAALQHQNICCCYSMQDWKRLLSSIKAGLTSWRVDLLSAQKHSAAPVSSRQKLSVTESLPSLTNPASSFQPLENTRAVMWQIPHLRTESVKLQDSDLNYRQNDSLWGWKKRNKLKPPPKQSQLIVTFF